MMDWRGGAARLRSAPRPKPGKVPGKTERGRKMNTSTREPAAEYAEEAEAWTEEAEAKAWEAWDRALTARRAAVAKAAREAEAWKVAAEAAA